MKKFNVIIYYTGFCDYCITADNEEDAITKARNLSIKKEEFFSTLENWKEADTAEEIKDEKSEV